MPGAIFGLPLHSLHFQKIKNFMFLAKTHKKKKGIKGINQKLYKNYEKKKIRLMVKKIFLIPQSPLSMSAFMEKKKKRKKEKGEKFFHLITEQTN